MSRITSPTAPRQHQGQRCHGHKGTGSADPPALVLVLLLLVTPLAPLRTAAAASPAAAPTPADVAPPAAAPAPTTRSQQPPAAPGGGQFPALGADVSVGGVPLKQLLAPVLDYEFSLPTAQLQRAAVYSGPNQRLRGLLAAAMAGRLPNNNTLRVGLVGGSIAWGHGERSWTGGGRPPPHD
jgi:hypothetical protein